MKRWTLPRIAGFLWLAVGWTGPAHGDQAGDDSATFGQSLAGGDVTFNFRYRFETVDEDRSIFAGRDANASTLRTALQYASKPFKGFHIFLEAENVTVVGNDLTFNNAGAGSLGNGVRDRPVVADPDGTEIQQAYLRWANDRLALQVGRQEILLGNQRFVGNVGWRQNHQSFDSVGIVLSGDADSKVSYYFIDEARRIFGDRKPMASHVLQGDLQVSPQTKVSLYGLFLDYDRPVDRRLSTQTLGGRVAGQAKTGGERIFHYTAEFAVQEDAADNPLEIDADYRFLELGYGTPLLTLRAGWEVLEGTPGSGSFSTPLATLHKFNGWADRFLNTPPDGLEDRYLSLGGAFQRIRWSVIYHDFLAESASLDYGSEIDGLFTYRAPWDQLFGLKWAFYDADAFSVDIDKMMVWTSYRFKATR